MMQQNISSRFETRIGTLEAMQEQRANGYT